MPSTVTIEARSLAALNTLAANPPQYPRNPAHSRQDPLVLYISRVPGTRDVILSTFRPGLKNVTAEDIASSLYYVHCELPGPSSPPRPSRQARQLSDSHNHPRPSFESLQSVQSTLSKSIRRKPLPLGSPVCQPSPDEKSASPTPIPSPALSLSPSLSPWSQFNVHPLLRTPVQEPPPESPLLSAPSDSPMLRAPSPCTLAPTPSPSMPVRPPPRPSKNLYLPSARKPLPWSAPASPPALDAHVDTRCRRGFAAPDDCEIPPPVPPRHPRRLSEQGMADAYLSRRPPTPTDSPPQPLSLLLSPPPPYSPPSPSTGPPRGSLDKHSRHSRHMSISPRPSLDPSGPLTPQSVVDVSPPAPKTLTPPPASAPAAFTLTLIRREPSSSSQWNVGRITGLSHAHHPHDPEPNDADAGPGPLLYIHIDTLGYAKFANPISYRQYAGMDPRSTMSTTTSRLSQPQNSLSTSPSNDGGGDTANLARIPRMTGGSPGFQRQVHAVYGRSWASNIKGIFRRSSHLDAPAPGMHLRKDSADSLESLHEKDGHRDSKLRGYDFESPWEGRCEFRTAEHGRILRCQHHLPVQVLPGCDSTRDPVSELRLSLPSNRHVRSKSGSDVGTGQAVHGHFSRFMSRPSDGNSEEDEWDDDDETGPAIVSPFDLHLGREKAGGGHKGKRAKMGKLIIHDAGVKMLDLVVAANIGLWWKLWDEKGM